MDALASRSTDVFAHIFWRCKACKQTSKVEGFNSTPSSDRFDWSENKKQVSDAHNTPAQDNALQPPLAFFTGAAAAILAPVGCIFMPALAPAGHLFAVLRDEQQWLNVTKTQKKKLEWLNVTRHKKKNLLAAMNSRRSPARTTATDKYNQKNTKGQDLM